MGDEPDVHVFNTEGIQARTAEHATDSAIARLRQALRELGTHYAHITSLEVWEDDTRGTYHARLEWTPA